MARYRLSAGKRCYFRARIMCPIVLHFQQLDLVGQLQLSKNRDFTSNPARRVKTWARKVLDSADIVRDSWLQQLPSLLCIATPPDGKCEL